MYKGIDISNFNLKISECVFKIFFVYFTFIQILLLESSDSYERTSEVLALEFYV